MAHIDIDTVLGWRGKTLRDRDGDKVGSIDEIYLDNATSRPEWAAVSTGLFGRRQTFVPLSDARAEGDDITVPYEKQAIHDAPNVDPDVQLSEQEEEHLYRHYGRAWDDGHDGHDGDAGRDLDRDGVRDDLEGDHERGRADAPRGDGPEVIRSEEELTVTKKPVAKQYKYRLRKHIVTENVEKTVPVRKEVVALETSPPPNSELVDER
jgi:sporulation protein YlmC with PRC-barrel domain